MADTRDKMDLSKLPNGYGADEQYVAPSKPVISNPAPFIEISNLQPILNIDFEKSEDAYYISHVAFNTWGIPDNPSGWTVNQYRSGGIVNQERNASQGSASIGSRGRICALEFKVKPSEATRIFCEVYSLPLNYLYDRWSNTSGTPLLPWSDEWGDSPGGTLIHSGFLDSEGVLYVPYEKTRVFNYLCFALSIPSATSSDDVIRIGGLTRSDPSIEMAFSGIGINENDLSYHYENSFSSNSPCVTYYKASGHEGDIRYDVELTTDGSTWTPLYTEILNGTNFTYDCTSIINSGIETNRAKIRVRGIDQNSETSQTWRQVPDNEGEWSESQIFSILKHIPPEKPINLKISDTGIIDRSLVNRLSWKYIQNSLNNRQGRANIQWRKQGDSTWNDIPVDGMSQFYDVPVNTFSLGAIEWKVKTYNYVDMEGPYSDVNTFVAKDTPVGPTITAPNGLVAEPSPAVAWEHSYIQTHYQINVLDLSDNVIWTTGETASISLSSKIAKYLANLTTYKIQVRVKTNEWLWSSYVTQLFNTDYQFPSPAIVTATSGSGFIAVGYDNPTPSGQQPIVVRNEVYKMIDNEWIKISDASPHSFNDYAAANKETHYYFVRSIASNGAYTDSDIFSATVNVQGVVLYLVNDPEGTLHQFRIDGHGRSKKWSIESSLMRFKGRKYPVIEIGTTEDHVIDFTLILEDEEEKQALDKIIYSGHICCYRDGRGRLAYGIFTEYPETDERWGGYTVNLSLTKIDYHEGSAIADEDDGIINVVVDGGEY